MTQLGRELTRVTLVRYLIQTEMDLLTMQPVSPLKMVRRLFKKQIFQGVRVSFLVMIHALTDVLVLV